MNRVLVAAIIFTILSNCYQDPPQQPSLTNPFDPENSNSLGDPFQVSAFIQHDTVYVSWQALNLEDLSQYSVYRSVDGVESVERQGSTNETDWIDGDISYGHSYHYWVTATNTNKEESDRSLVTPAEVHTAPLFQINGGHTQAFSKDVDLLLQAPLAVDMMISNNAQFLGAQWQSYITDLDWQLQEISGWRIVYAKVRYADQSISAVVSDSIFLDLDAPPMVFIEAGNVIMGSNDGDDGDSDERPQHTVLIDEFWMDTYEVTNFMYARFLTDGNEEYYRPGMKIDKQADNSYKAQANYQDHPVVFVSFDGAAAYAAWRGCSLPTEAQWERAARGDDARIYPWGNQITATMANYWNNGDPFDQQAPATTPVGMFDGTTTSGFATADSPSPFGVYDMAGNVWEWCLDWYDADYYASSGAMNPAGPVAGTSRVVRGGSWRDEPYYCRAAARSYRLPFESRDNVGFRCVKN